jgi:hypothetical protein
MYVLVESHVLSVVMSERVHLAVWFLAYVRRVDVLLRLFALKKFCSPGLVIFLGQWMTSKSLLLLVTTDSGWVCGGVD